MINYLLAMAFLGLSSCAQIETRNHDSKSTQPKKTESTKVVSFSNIKQKTKIAGQSSINLTTTPEKETESLAGADDLKKAQQFEKEGLYVDAIKYNLNYYNANLASKETEKVRLKCIEMIENKLSVQQLVQITESADFGSLRGHAAYRLADIALDAKDKDLAKKYFSATIDFAPNTDIAVKAQDMYSQLQATRSVDSRTIGVILPLSGKNSNVGQRALRAIEMGLGIHQANSPFKIAVIDSEGNPDTARRAVEKLVKEDNVIAIIGSLLSKTATAVASKAEELGVPTIALSQKSGVTDVGSNIFRNALTAQMQVRQLVKTAMETNNMKKFAILYPNDPYGVEFANLFWDEVLVRGGQITAAQIYNPKDTDFKKVAQRLVGTYYIEDRSDEFKIRQKEIQEEEKNKKKSIRDNSQEDVLPAITDFDAIFIPDSAKSMGQLAAFLSYAGVKNVSLLGTNLWNVPGVAKRAGNFSNRLFFVDGLLANSSSPFLTEFKTLFGEDPTLVDIQAFDSASLLKTVIMEGANRREYVTNELSKLKKFQGAIGNLSISKEREILRPITVLTVDKGEIVPLFKN